MYEFCPVALAWGMSWDEFWYGPLHAVLSYYTKWKTEKELEPIKLDTQAWLIGSYIQLAVASVLSPKDAKYPPKPQYVSSLEEKQKTEEDIVTETFLQLDSWRRLVSKGMKKDKER